MSLDYTPQDEARFWAKVDRSGACWVWMAGTLNGKHSYGRFRLGKRRYLAHRLAYMLTYGPIPDTIDVLHRCDNPPCCNPDHLFLGTDADNSQDKVAKGRQAWGERSGMAKLSAADVRDLRYFRSCGMSFARLAALYGVDSKTVRSAVSGETWAHLDALPEKKAA